MMLLIITFSAVSCPFISSRSKCIPQHPTIVPVSAYALPFMLEARFHTHTKQ